MAVLLMFFVVAAAFPKSAVTVYAESGKDLQLGGDALSTGYNTADAQILYMGNGTGDPYEWVVIGWDGDFVGKPDNNGAATVLAKGIMGTTRYKPPVDPLPQGYLYGNSNTYDDSLLRSAIAAISGNFSGTELNAIIARELQRDCHGEDWTGHEGDFDDACDGIIRNDKTVPVIDKLWPLSQKEVQYDYIGPVAPDGTHPDEWRKLNADILNINAKWWLRSPGQNYPYQLPSGSQWNDWIGYVDDSYAVNGSNIKTRNADCRSHHEYGIRPAFNLNLSSIIFTSAAVGGKDCGTADPGALTAPAAYSGSSWKVTLLDGSRNFSAARTTSGDVATGDDITISYNGASVGTDEYVSAILLNSSGDLLYYGRIVDKSSGNTSGTTGITIPEGLNVGAYTLKVFSEQCNGDKKTDYASAFSEIPLNVVNRGSYNVTFKVENGSWNDETTDDITVTVSGNEGNPLYLSAVQIPEVGGKPAENYKAGSWDVTPAANREITRNTTFTYTYAKQDTISYNVTFKVKNGSWDDGTSENKVVTLSRYENEDKALVLSADQIPAVGNRPAENYKAGSWDTVPETNRTISGDKVYTYSYERKADPPGPTPPPPTPPTPPEPEPPAPVTYTVTLDANGGTVSQASLKTDEEGKLSYLPSAKRKGYTFKGWFTALSEGTKITTSTVFTKDTTIYAQWKRKKTDSTPVDDHKDESPSTEESSGGKEEDKKPADPVNELRGELAVAIVRGGKQTITWNKGDSLPYDIMKMLQDHQDLTLIFNYIYHGVHYSVTLSGKNIAADPAVQWYGPVYLWLHYGKGTSAGQPVNGRTYTVKKGDTLSGIAAGLGTTMNNLMSKNNIQNKDRIRIGQVLKY